MIPAHAFFKKCKLCGIDLHGLERKTYHGLCFDCWKHADCCGLEKL